MASTTQWARLTNAILALEDEEVRIPARAVARKRHAIKRLRMEGYSKQAIDALESHLAYMDPTVMRSQDVAFNMCTSYLARKGYSPS
jgi:hypothetical protein